jgi:hypothetical protein
MEPQLLSHSTDQPRPGTSYRDLCGVSPCDVAARGQQRRLRQRRKRKLTSYRGKEDMSHLIVCTLAARQNPPFFSSLPPLARLQRPLFFSSVKVDSHSSFNGVKAACHDSGILFSLLLHLCFDGQLKGLLQIGTTDKIGNKCTTGLANVLSFNGKHM